MKLISVIAFVAIAISGLWARSNHACRKNPKVVAECFKVHGRVRVVNGAGTVIWRVGTDRKLWVEDEELIPDNLAEAMYKKKGDVYGRDVFGDFEVCPFSKSREGEMQVVCIESAARLVVKENTH